MRALGLAACAAVLFAALAGTASAQGKRPLPALAPAPADGLTRALEANRLTEAEYALQRARSLFDLAKVRRSFGAVERPGLRDATAILRDLALRQHELAGFDRTLARALLARPDDGNVPYGLGTGWDPVPVPANVDHRCSDFGIRVCVHWVNLEEHPDAPDLTDDDENDVPDYIDEVIQTMDEIWLKLIGEIGYREPKDDSESENPGIEGELDIYIDDLDTFAFGYCTTDDPLLSDPDVYDLSAYCVLDNDYASFGPLPPEDYLRVTAAHEFFHAVQYAYDAFEDGWLLEGTATNMETTVYPDIHDNLSFLGYSPLTRPASPLDRYGFLDSEYGSWIFFRFLEEKVAGGDAGIVREIWERADASAEAAYGDMYSLQAVRRALSARGVGFPHAFAQFGQANRLRTYVDGALYPAPPFTRTWALGGGRADTGWRSWRIDHLATRHYSFRPAKGASKNGKLRVRVRLPRADSRATLIVVRPSGKTSTRYLTPNAKGVAGSTVWRFARGQVRRAHLVLTNGSTRTRCWEDGSGPPFFSCYGAPRDDRRVFELRARFRR
ncbi:MAG TPA: MXAN_6640 family putative metalloprotease [Gaiellaceae bacterium]|nr:MXAN_6640 family putative metalloprotease [Gaiellaceae bacterium]